MVDEIAAKYVLFDFEVITLIALAVGVLAYALVRRMRHLPLEGPGGGAPDYDGFDLVLMFFPAMMFLINPIAEALMAGKEETPTPGESAPIGVVALLVSLGYFTFVGIMTYGLIEWVRDRRVADLFGLRRQGLPNILVFSILGGVFSLLLCGWLVGDFANTYIESVFGELDLQEPVKMLQESDSMVHLGLSILMACVAAPLVEEFLFRGYFYGTLRQLTHPVFAAVIVGALFGVVHGNLPALLPLWVFSILLCLAYEMTRCLWVPVGMHVIFNAANIILMLMPEPAK